MKNQKQLETVLYSSVGVIILLVIAIALNLIFARVSTRIDLTADKVYTLSDGTRAVLGKLDTPVQLRFYFSQSANDLDVGLRTYAQRVEDLLNEYRIYSKGKIEVKKLDPKPDSEAEDSANLDGVEGQMAQLGGDKIYFGLAISCLDAKTAIPFISPQRERLLEYDLTRAISQVVKPVKPNLGIMSGLPVFGEMNPMMMMRGGGRQEPWVFVSELKADFNVKEVPISTDKIDDDINLLLVVYPKGISDAAQYAIDQFVLRGGKLVAFLDPLSVFDSGNNPSNPLQAAAGSGASMDKLLKAWGLEFDINKVVSDKQFLTELQDPRTGRPQPNPSFLSLTQAAMDTNDVATTQLGRILLPFAGHFTGTPVEGLKQSVLFRSSTDSQLTDKMMAQFGATEEFKPSGTEQKLGIRLTGKFKTAFPDGKPGADAKDGDKKDGDDKKADTGAQLKEAKEEGVVVLIGDADMLHQNFFARVQELFGQRIMMPFAANLTFLQNLVEQMGGDKDLIGIRSRATLNRPFTRVREMQAKAELSYESKIRQLEKDLSDAQQRLNDLQRAKGEGQQAILSEEQKKEISQFQRKRAEVNKELKEVRKNLRRDVDSLETTAKWANILLMPFAVSLAGIVIATFKRKRTAAQ
ncbi:MAG: Gldg family protein [Verrucomicrobiales bacterium]|nr:Gldg family protein [Verrucomicrobiales bacterium]